MCLPKRSADHVDAVYSPKRPRPSSLQIESQVTFHFCIIGAHSLAAPRYEMHVTASLWAAMTLHVDVSRSVLRRKKKTPS